MLKINKTPNLLVKVRHCIEQGLYLDTRHSTDRQSERNITRPEILYVLKNGRHEKSKDMEKKIKRSHIDNGFGFPVKLLNVPMTKIRGEWTPAINYNLLAKVVLKELCEKDSKLTGSEVRFIRQHFEMTLQQFAKRFGVTHPAVMKWEGMKNNSTGVNWATEKDIRLFVLHKLKSKSSEIVDLYSFLENVMDGERVSEVKVDARKIAA